MPGKTLVFLLSQIANLIFSLSHTSKTIFFKSFVIFTYFFTLYVIARLKSICKVIISYIFEQNSLRKKSPHSTFFWYVFATFGLNTEIYRVKHIQFKCQKMRTRKKLKNGLFLQNNSRENVSCFLHDLHFFI